MIIFLLAVMGVILGIYYFNAVILSVLTWIFLGSMAFLGLFFVIGTLPFWLLILGAACLAFWLIDDDFSGLHYHKSYRAENTGLTVLLVGLGILFQFLSEFKPFSIFLQYWYYIIPGYFIGGFTTPCLRWIWHSAWAKHKARNEKEKFFKEHGIVDNVIPASHLSAWQNIADRHQKPQVKPYLNRLVRLGVFWPVSFPWFLIRELVFKFGRILRVIFRFVFRRLQNFLQWCTDCMWGDIEKEFESVRIEPPSEGPGLVPKRTDKRIPRKTYEFDA